MTKFKPSCNNSDFDEISCDLDIPPPADQPVFKPADVRKNYIVKTTVRAIYVALAVAGGFGYVFGDWIPFQYTWALVAVPLGATFSRL